MKISTEISSTSKYVGEEKAVEYVAKAGFDAWDFSMFGMGEYSYVERKYVPVDHPLSGRGYLAFARKLKNIGLDNGIVCNQSHAPFPSHCPEIRSMYKRAIECTAEAGGKICVIHPDTELDIEGNAEMYLELLPFAKECGVKIAAENMFGWTVDSVAIPSSCGTPELFMEQLNAIDDEYFVACLDIGHAEMVGEEVTAELMIKTLGNKLQALHIHDNDKKLDLHQIPFSMEIDFEKMIKALKEINYCGYLTLEANTYMNNFNAGNAFEGVKGYARVAKRLADMFEGMGE